MADIEMTPDYFYVGMKDFAFFPPSISWLLPGDSIIFDNVGPSVHKLGGYAESPDLQAGQAYQVVFTKPGLYKFHCVHYPNMEFVARVMKPMKVK